MTDLAIWPDCHLSARIKETIECDVFDLVTLENGENCAIYFSGSLETNLTDKRFHELIKRKI